MQGKFIALLTAALGITAVSTVSIGIELITVFIFLLLINVL